MFSPFRKNERYLSLMISTSFLFFQKEDFKKYADYCTNQPLSCLELSKLEANPIYRQFFEVNLASEFNWNEQTFFRLL